MSEARQKIGRKMSEAPVTIKYVGGPFDGKLEEVGRYFASVPLTTGGPMHWSEARDRWEGASGAGFYPGVVGGDGSAVASRVWKAVKPFECDGCGVQVDVPTRAVDAKLVTYACLCGTVLMKADHALDATWTAPSAPDIPPWIHLLSDVLDGSPLSTLHILGFWDMKDGDWHANGQWNPKPWEVWERNATALALPVGSMMPFPALMKRAYDDAAEDEQQAMLDGFLEIFRIIEDLAKRVAP